MGKKSIFVVTLMLFLCAKTFAQDPCGGTGYIVNLCIPCYGTGVFYGYPCGACGGYGATRVPCTYCANRQAYEMGRRQREIDDRNRRQQGVSGNSGGYSGGYSNGYSGGYSSGSSSSSSSTRRTCPGCHGEGKGIDQITYVGTDDVYCSTCGKVTPRHAHHRPMCRVCYGKGYVE